MAESKQVKIDLPEGSIEVKGSEEFLMRVRAALAGVIAGQERPPAGTMHVVEPVVPPPPSHAGQLPHGRRTTIRDLYAEKRPATDTQTAALIAYYISELAPSDEKSETVDTETIIKYFKLCPRELPKRKKIVLSNAKRDGYLDSTSERGRFRLNAIGYNLVVHGLPAGPEVPPATRRRGGSGKARKKKATGRRKRT